MTRYLCTNKYLCTIRNKEDSNNYLKDKSHTIISFDSYMKATQFIQEHSLTSTCIIEPVNLSIMYVVENKDTENDNFGKQRVLNMYQLLCEVNRNDEDWEDFDQTDILSGLADYTEYKLVGVYLEVI